MSVLASHRRNRTYRGHTLVEMLVAMAVLGIVMSLAAFEFQSVIAQHNFVQSHLDAEQQARIAMSKLSVAVRQASVDVTDFPSPGGPVTMPTAGTSTASEIQYYAVAGLSPQALPTDGNGAPIPCYDQVTITYQTPAPMASEGTLLKTVAPVGLPCVATAPSPEIIATNVDYFNVTERSAGSGYKNSYNITLSIKAEIINLSRSASPLPTQYTLSTTLSPLAFGKTN